MVACRRPRHPHNRVAPKPLETIGDDIVTGVCKYFK